MPIQVLDQSTINKIAAGEVIERPASIVKELVENAIDAKATAITIEIKDGGISFIRITDNGCGIPLREIPLAFLRHSTSKIKSIEDLAVVSSLGFRGEALSSIAAIAQVELITKTKESFTGSRYVIEGGKEISLEEIGAPEGTTFIVRNLFYNTPVRRKFLKTAVTEAGYIDTIIQHLALSHPDVSFRFINNNQNKLHTAGNSNLRDIVYHVFGREISNNVLLVNQKTQDIELDGYIGKPVISRGNRSYENYYINGRYIKSSIISKAIEEAYKGFIMMHKYPFTVLHFKINPTIIDVNVHPTKMELRFSQNEFVYEFVVNAIRNTISKRELIPNVEFDNHNAKPVVKPQVISETRLDVKPEAKPQVKIDVKPDVKPVVITELKDYVNQNIKPEVKTKIISEIKSEEKPLDKQSNNSIEKTVQKPIEKPIDKPNDLPSDKPFDKQILENKTANPFFEPTKAKLKERLPEPFEIKRSNELLKEDNLASEYGEKSEQLQLFTEDKLLDAHNKNKHKLIGQLFETYWLIEFEDKLFIMDQHAAHEKILFEKMMKMLQDKKMDTQMLNPPVILSLNMREEQVLKQNFDIFTRLGYELESFGGNEYKVVGIPANLPSVDNKNLLVEILDGLVDENLSRYADTILEKVASMSCKAAVKGNHKLSSMEAEALIDQLLEAENPYHCPHGRPTLISMTKYELEKKFKRIV